MRVLKTMAATLLVVLTLAAAPSAQDAAWPKEMTFALLSTENAAEITRRWGPIIAQLEKDLKVRIKPVTATDYRGTIEALKFKNAEIGHLGPKPTSRRPPTTTPTSSPSPSCSWPTGRSAIGHA